MRVAAPGGALPGCLISHAHLGIIDSFGTVKMGDGGPISSVFLEMDWVEEILVCSPVG